MLLLLARLFQSAPRRRIAILLGVAVGCMVLGGVLFALIESIPITTGLYWAVTTATTVGYGDVIPHHPVSRLIAVFVMLTTIPLLASVFALVTGGAAVAGVRRILAMHSHFPDGTYRLVIGMNPVVPAILEELVAAGESVVLVADVEPARLPPEVHLVRGDPTQLGTIRQARPSAAGQALITGDTDGDVLVSSVLIRRLAPELTTAALVNSPSVREALEELGIQQAVSAHELVARTLAKSLEAPHAGDMVSQLVESKTHRLFETEADVAAIGRPLSAVRDERTGLVLGLVHDGKFTLGLADDPVIAQGDRLLIAEPDGRQQEGREPAAAT